MKIEICSNSFASAKAAQNGGASRVELCSELAMGGVTPSHALIAKTVSELKIPVHVLIRPRSGNFVYTEDEIDIMIHDIKYCAEVGCVGVVSGALHEDNSLHMAFAKRLIEAAQGMHFTFHRAFDCVADPFKTLELLKELGVQRILSSGLKPKAIEGFDLLKELLTHSGDVEIMPGSGVNIDNVLQFKKAGFTSVHLSAQAKTKKTDDDASLFGTSAPAITDVDLVREIVKSTQQLLS